MLQAVKARFDADGIAFAVPQREVQLHQGPPTSA
jgi:hypothetical protein